MTAPPVAATLRTVEPPVGVKRMRAVLHPEPPRPAGASAITSGNPPAMSTVRSLPLAKKPRRLPSGDQNWFDAPSVPGDGPGIVGRQRTHPQIAAFAVAATKAIFVPSGEMVDVAQVGSNLEFRSGRRPRWPVRSWRRRTPRASAPGVATPRPGTGRWPPGPPSRRSIPMDARGVAAGAAAPEHRSWGRAGLGQGALQGEPRVADVAQPALRVLLEAARQQLLDRRRRGRRDRRPVRIARDDRRDDVA